MPPIAPREYFAELLAIGEFKASQSERLQQVELVVEQFMSELEAANIGDVEAETIAPGLLILSARRLSTPQPASLPSSSSIMRTVC